ncbi:MAG: hypothetical protein GY786_19400 [Proteobacteria bacterium]|nr:hypothetical protein [Pseudomonadota bacterium]
MTQHSKQKKKSFFLVNSLFVLLLAGVLIFLLNAPEETTSFLPKDEMHLQFHGIKSKKEAEKFCLECHDIGKDAPLPEGHPPKFRCLFCHKRK